MRTPKCSLAVASFQEFESFYLVTDEITHSPQKPCSKRRVCINLPVGIYVSLMKTPPRALLGVSSVDVTSTPLQDLPDNRPYATWQYNFSHESLTPPDARTPV